MPVKYTLSPNLIQNLDKLQPDFKKSLDDVLVLYGATEVNLSSHYRNDSSSHSTGRAVDFNWIKTKSRTIYFNGGQSSYNKTYDTEFLNFCKLFIPFNFTYLSPSHIYADGSYRENKFSKLSTAEKYAKIQNKKSANNDLDWVHLDHLHLNIKNTKSNGKDIILPTDKQAITPVKDSILTFPLLIAGLGIGYYLYKGAK